MSVSSTGTDDLLSNASQLLLPAAVAVHDFYLESTSLVWDGGCSNSWCRFWKGQHSKGLGRRLHIPN